MKKTFLYFSLFLTFSASAETLKEGRITYEISMPKMNGEDVDEQMKAMMPYESIQYYKGDKMRNEMKAGFGSTVTLMEQGGDSITLLMEMMGMKTYRRMPVEGRKKGAVSGEKPEIKQTDESRKIAGYTCKKTLMTFKTEEGEPVQMEAWITEELEVPVQGNPQFDSVKGVALEFDFSVREMSMHMKATKVEKVPVSDDLFLIPDGFTEGPMFPGMEK
jgi:GLPGLI family protein